MYIYIYKRNDGEILSKNGNNIPYHSAGRPHPTQHVKNVKRTEHFTRRQNTSYHPFIIWKIYHTNIASKIVLENVYIRVMLA